MKVETVVTCEYSSLSRFPIEGLNYMSNVAVFCEFIDLSCARGGGRAGLPKGISMITFEKDKLETPKFAYHTSVIDT